MKLIILTCYFLLIIAPGFGQKIKFGKISSEQWKINKCSFDSTSNAIIIFDIGNISIKAKNGVKNKDPDCQLQSEFFDLTYKRHIRIKVLADNGLTSDLLTIYLRSSDNKKDRLTSFKGLLLMQINGKEVKRKYKSSDLLEEISEDGSSEFILDMVDIKAGSIIDINYTIETNNLTETPEWNFINDYPNLYSEINFSIPTFFLSSKKCDLIETLSYEAFHRSVDYGVSYTLNNGWKYNSYTYTERHEEYSLTNIGATKELKEMYKLKYIINSIRFLSVQCEKGGYSKN